MSDKCVEEVKAAMHAWVWVGMPRADHSFSSCIARVRHTHDRESMPEYRAMVRELALLLRQKK